MAERDISETVARIGPRLRAFRSGRNATLAQLSELSGISVSTLSRLESGDRRPTLELVLRLARAYQVSVEDLVGDDITGDPRVRARPIRRGGRTMIPLTRRPGGLQAYKIVIAAKVQAGAQQTHEGWEWLYVLNGILRLRLGELDLTMQAGEVAEFDTRTPHSFGSSGGRPVEILVLFGAQGERIHVRARPAARARSRV